MAAIRQVAVMVGALGALSGSMLLVKLGGFRAKRPGPVAVSAAVPSPELAVAKARPADGKVRPGLPKMIHLDGHHTNRSPFKGPEKPVVRWTFDTSAAVEGAPAVLDDGTILVASLGGKLYGLDREGQQRFAVELGDRVYGSPLVTDDGIFVGSDAHKFFGLTTAGAIRWRLDTDADADTGAAPLPGGALVFASGRIIYAVKPNGSVLWRVRTLRKTFASPAVGDDGAVFVGSQDDHVYGIEEDGKVRFRVDVGGDADGAPAIADDGTVIVGTDKGEVLALGPADGAIRWRASVGGFVRGCLSIARDGTILAGTYGPAPRLVALDPEDGKLRWAYAVPGTGAAEFGIHGAPVEDADGRLYFGAQDDFLYALDREGHLLWKFRTGGDLDAPAVLLDDGTLLAGSDDGKLYAIRAP